MARTKKTKKIKPLPRRRPEPGPDLRAELPLWPETVRRGALIEQLRKHVTKLRAEADAHGNRRLFLDDVFVAYLLAFFNPSIRTLRTLEDFSQTRQAQKHLSIPKICRSTLSDFRAIADPARLGPIVAALRGHLLRKSAGGRLPDDLRGLHRQILAVDGTFLPAAAAVAWAVAARNQRAGERHRARLDWQVDVATWLPELVVVPDPGESEPDSAARQVVPGAISIYDRAYLSFRLVAAFYDRDPATGTATAVAEFVIRLKEPGPDAPTLEGLEARPVAAADTAAGIVSDRLVRLPGLKRSEGLEVILREVVLIGADGQLVRLLTSLLTVPAHVIALLYKHRWQVELFFRWLKSYGHFNHLIAHSPAGVLLSFYGAVIGVLLMYLHTGYRPSKYALALLGTAAEGAALEEIMPILRERERQCELARRSAARRRARKRTGAA